jgi:hypothetical protein
MSNKVNLFIDTVPYPPDIYNDKENLYQSDFSSINTVIPTYQTIFVFSLNVNYATTENLNMYNDPNYMLYGYNNSFATKLPSIGFYSTLNSAATFSLNNTLKILYKTYIFTPEILELLTDIGYDTTIDPDTNKPKNLFPPYQYQQTINSEFDTNLLFQKIEVYDAITNRTSETIFIYFYQNYITSDIIDYNNPKFPLKSSVYYEKKKWNVFIYPLTKLTNEYYLPNINNYIPPIPKSIITKNTIDTINFDNKDYMQYCDKIDYKWFENKNFVKDDNKLNTSMNYSKNTITFANYYKNKIDSGNENYFMSLNEITKNNNINNIEQSFSEINTLKFLSKSKTYSNINAQFSMSYDNKMSYINNKFNQNDLTYVSYNYLKNGIDMLYPLCKNFYINTYVNLQEIYVPENVYYLQITNWYIRKILLLINPLIIINQNYVTMNICPISDVKNNLKVNGINVEHISINFASTFNYYVDRFKLTIIVYDYNYAIKYKYYVILNIAYYNSFYLSIKNTDRTSDVNDLGYISYTYMDSSNTLVPTFFEKVNKTKSYQYLLDYNTTHTKNYSFNINYNLLSSNITQENLLYFNHFNYLIPQVNSIINYEDCNTKITENYNISNMFNVIEKKINNFISNIVLSSNNYNSIKSDINNSESIIKISLTFDSNIIYDYEKCIQSHNNNCKNINYIEYLKYIDNNFGGSAIPYMEFNLKISPRISDFMIPTGNFLVFKYRNNFLPTDNNGNIVNMSNNILESILKNNSLIFNYNFALLVKIDDDFNPDDTFFLNNNNLFMGDFKKLVKYLSNQGNFQTKIYLVPCNTDYSLYYYKLEQLQASLEQQQISLLLGIELFNYYNGANITNGFNFIGNKIFINLVLNEYMNFYELIFIIDSFYSMKENNTLCFDKNNLIFKKHNGEHIKNIVKYDSLRFNSNIPPDINEWNCEILILLDKNKNAVNYIKVLNNNLIFIFNCNKMVNLLKRCLLYLTQIKNIIFFTNFNCSHPSYAPCIKCKNNNNCDNKICDPCFNCFNNIKWKNYLLDISEFINIINYLATCCININKVNQIINTTFCQEISCVDSLLTLLININNNITIQYINNLIIQIEETMVFYEKRIKMLIEPINELFDELENNLTVTLDFNFKNYKKQYVDMINEIYINNIILYAINTDVLKIFDGIIIKPTQIIDVDDFIINSLIEIINIIDIYKLNLNILIETLNFVRLFYNDHSVQCIFPVLNDNIIKTNYIYNTEYYNQTNNLPNINIYTYFPPNPPNNLSNIVKSEIDLLISMLADTYKVNYLTTVICPSKNPPWNIYTKKDFMEFCKTLKDLINNSEILFNLSEPITNVSFFLIYDYSYDIVQKFISNCLEVKLFIKAMFYLNKINKHISHNCLLYYFTNATEYIKSIENIYDTINSINTDPNSVINQYEEISNLLIKEFSTIENPIFTPTNNYLFSIYNQNSLLVIFLRGLEKLKNIFVDEIIIDKNYKPFKYIYLGYQGEDIIPYNDYNLLIDQRSYVNININKILNYMLSNMHTFNSNLNIIKLINSFNNTKKRVNDYYLLINSDNNNSLQLNAIQYGYINTNYIFINVDNVNY